MKKLAPLTTKSRKPACSVPAKGVLHTLSGDRAMVWQVPEEVPIAFLINSENFAVMMATPQDLEDFAAGFALTEGVVADAAAIASLLILPEGAGFIVDLAIPEAGLNRDRLARRGLEGRSGCGLCGVAAMADVIRLPGANPPPTELSPQAVARAYEALPGFQPMGAVNRTVHAAAWCSADGRILMAREDVGRHNALDKLIGAMAREGTSARGGFVLMSSRCSFELVQKCAVAGIGALATVSAPTALALELAARARVKLAALAQSGVMIFDGATP